MVTYKYKAISWDGAPVSGIIEAADEYEAVSKIKESCSLVTKITPVKVRQGILTMEIGSKKIDLKALSVVCSQFAIILKAGMRITQCVELIADQTADKKLKKLLEEVAEGVAAGHSMADSFEKSGKDRLPITFIETIRAGEHAGTVDTAFESLYHYFEKRYKTKQKVMGALTYPIFVIITAIVSLIVVMIKVVPTITSIFAEMGGDLPAPTKLLIGMSNFFAKNILFIILAVILAIILFKVYTNTEEGRIRWNRFTLRVPVLGKISWLNGASQFANTMGTLLAAGLPVTQALGVTAKTMDNYMLGIETGKMVTGIEEGRRLGDCMREKNIYPKTLNEMCAIGEETGELESTLETIGEYFDNEAGNATAKAISMLEPTIMVFMAIISGFIVISIYLPIFTMYDMM